MLAQSYAALYDLQARAMDKLLLDAQCAGIDASILTGMADVQHQLRDRIRQLETAMARLGLVILRPEQGEAFNGAYHVPAGTSAGAVGDAVIARCVTPGVMAQGAPEALLRAEVELQ